jgi:hypothetical protein
LYDPTPPAARNSSAERVFPPPNPSAEKERHMRYRATYAAFAFLVIFAAVITARAEAATPSVTVRSATAVTTTDARLHAGVNPHGLATTYAFEYGTTRSYGLRTATQPPEPARACATSPPGSAD